MDRSEKVAVLSVGNNLFLSAVKLGLAVLSGSIALVADAIHSFTDVVSSLTVFAGLKIARRKSRGFPYGLYKVENLVSLLLASAIFFAGYEIAKQALVGSSGKGLKHIPIALSGVVVTVLVTFLFSRYEMRAARSVGSPSLLADAHHVRTDMFSSLAILVGLGGHLLGLPLDRIAALVVIAFIARSGWSLLVDAVRVLLDASLGFETLDRVKTLILDEQKVQEIKGLWGRSSGRYKFIEADITIRESRLERAHAVTRTLEERIRAAIRNVDHILIHYAPIEKELLKYALPLADHANTISEHFGEAPFFRFVQVRVADNTLAEDETLPNPYTELERGKGIRVAEWLVANETDVLFLREQFEGKGPTYVFADANVEVRMTSAATVEGILGELQIEGAPVQT